MLNIDCEDCKKRNRGGCEKHPQKICTIQGCDRKCGWQVHGTLRRKPVRLPGYNFFIRPREDVKDGLLILWSEETETATKVSLADINKGQIDYELPPDMRTILGVYVKIR